MTRTPPPARTTDAGTDTEDESKRPEGVITAVHASVKPPPSSLTQRFSRLSATALVALMTDDEEEESSSEPAGERTAQLPPAPEAFQTTATPSTETKEPSVEETPRDPDETVTAWLLEQTLALDEEKAPALWASLVRAYEPSAREALLQRWCAQQEIAIPPEFSLQQLSLAAARTLAQLPEYAHDPERWNTLEAAQQRALFRVLRGWIRTAELDLEPLLEGIYLLLRCTAEGLAPLPDTERAAMASLVRRRAERSSAFDATRLLLPLVALEARTPVFSPHAEALLDFLLLEAELHSGFAAEFARLAHLPAWSHALRLGLQSIGRPAVRAARLLLAVAHNAEEANSFSPELASHTIDALRLALQHPRTAVWTRAARAAGLLAGSLAGLDDRLLSWIEPPNSVTIRRRACAALGMLSPRASEALRARKEALGTQQVEPWFVAALAASLPDRAALGDHSWTEAARAYAARGGPEAWGSLLAALRELSARSPEEHLHTMQLAAEFKRLAETHRSTSPAETELVDRTIALADRLLGNDNANTLSPTSVLWALSAHAAVDPGETALQPLVDELINVTDQTVAAALRLISQEQPRVIARAAVMLEEVTELIADGELAVVAERLLEGPARRSVLAFCEQLRSRLLRASWAGLLRPTPATVAWRRWLLRTAAVLPRVEPLDQQGPERALVARAQVLETLGRIADDPTIQQPAVQRYVLAALDELSGVLHSTLGERAPLCVLGWMALRTGTLPPHARTRRAWDGVPAEQVDRLYLLVEALAKPGRGGEREFQEFAALLGQGLRLPTLLRELATALQDATSKPPEAHWSGLPRADLRALARAADRLKFAREEAGAALTDDVFRPTSPGETLEDRAGKLDRFVTATSLKFLDGARRAEVVDHYVNELTNLAEAIASACGPVAGTPVRARLARALVSIRATAAELASEQARAVRYIGRLSVLGALSSSAEGGMTNTYLAEGPAPGKRVVVKLLPWERLGKNAASVREHFEGEMRRLAAATHPNVVSIIDAGFVEEGAYIAVEYIPGASLETMLRVAGPITLARLAPIIRDAARGLAYLHTRGVVHRDVKPGNLLVQLEGLPDPPTANDYHRAEFVRSVVIDLGVSTDATPSESDGEEDLVGTPGYLAPEVARGLEQHTTAVDVYALAVVVFEALTARNPFLEDDPELATVLVRHGTMPLPLELLPPELADRTELLELLADASEFAPEARPSMKEFVERWERAAR